MAYGKAQGSSQKSENYFENPAKYNDPIILYIEKDGNISSMNEAIKNNEEQQPLDDAKMQMWKSNKPQTDKHDD